MDSSGGSHASPSESATPFSVSRSTLQEVVGSCQAVEGSTEDTYFYCDEAVLSFRSEQGLAVSA